MKLSNDVEKYEIEVTKMGQNYSFFFTVYMSPNQYQSLQLVVCVGDARKPQHCSYNVKGVPVAAVIIYLYCSYTKLP